MSQERRLAVLENWRSQSDGIHPAGLPGRIHDVEQVIIEMRATVKVFRLFSAIVSTAVGLLVLYAALRGGA